MPPRAGTDITPTSSPNVPRLHFSLKAHGPKHGAGSICRTTGKADARRRLATIAEADPRGAPVLARPIMFGCLSSALSIVGRTPPAPADVQKVAQQRIVRAGGKTAALREFHRLMRGWHQNPYGKPAARRVREFGMLRTMLVALIDAPDCEPGAQQREAALGLLELRGC